MEYPREGDDFGVTRGMGMLLSINAAMRGGEGWHLALVLRDGTSMELAVYDFGEANGEAFVRLDSSEVEGGNYGKVLYVPESAVLMAWATEDPVVLGPAKRGGPPRAAMAEAPPGGRAAAAPAERPLYAWPAAGPSGSRWMDVRYSNHRAWFKMPGPDGRWEWAALEPSHHIARAPYVEVEHGDEWNLPPSWEGCDLAVAPAYGAMDRDQWPKAVLWDSRLSEEEMNARIEAAVRLAARGHSPVGGAFIFPLCWSEAVCGLLREKQLVRSGGA